MKKLTKSVEQMGEKVVSSVEGVSRSLNKFMQANSKPFPTHIRQWTCFRCGEVGHISRKCTKYPTRTSSLSAPRGNNVGSAHSENGEDEKCGVKDSCLIDTGSTRTTILCKSIF